MIDRILTDDVAVARAGRAARLRAAADFNWIDILSQYEEELAQLGGFALEPRIAPAKPSVGAVRKA